MASNNEKTKRVRQNQEGGGKITELFAKLNKHSESLAAGKPPAMRHFPLRIEGDIGEERTKLGEFQIELRKLEHTQHLIDHGPGNEDEMGDEPEEDSDIMDADSISGLSLGRGSGKEVEYSSNRKVVGHVYSNPSPVTLTHANPNPQSVLTGGGSPGQYCPVS